MHTYATSKPGVFAIGDIGGTHARAQSRGGGDQLREQLAGKVGHVNYDVIPSIIYTHPEVAWCGKTEEEVKATEPNTTSAPSPSANSPRETNDDSRGWSSSSAANTDKILGAHIVGPNAGSSSASASSPWSTGSTEDIARTCHGHRR